jgi:hypothetical protein
VRRQGPSEPGGIRRIHVGSGPNHLLAEWWNVDIRSFRGVDEVMDATIPWPWGNIEAVFGEHFLEHLEPGQALSFLECAAQAMRPGGRLRLSTPSLEWVWRTHLDLSSDCDAAARIAETYRVNRAFRGWGHRFLYSWPMLERLVSGAGFVDIERHGYGESEHAELRGLERHGGFEVVDGWPSVWIVEATRPSEVGSVPLDLVEEIEREFGRYVSSGH